MFVCLFIYLLFHYLDGWLFIIIIIIINYIVLASVSAV